MDFLDVKDTDEFYLESVKRQYGIEGEPFPFVTYVKGYGYKNSFVVKFEGLTKAEPVVLKQKATLGELRETFEDKRIFIDGMAFLDGQENFKKELAKD